MVIDFIPKVHWVLDCQAFRVFHPDFGIDVVYKCIKTYYIENAYQAYRMNNANRWRTYLYIIE